MTTNPPKISVVIPTLNEAQGIEAVVTRALQFAFEVIVVDAQSMDGTATLAEKAGAKVILERRRGYGRAYKTGFEAATGDLLASADGDGTYPIDEIPMIARALITEDLEFVSCARFPLKDPGSMNRLNKFGNKALSLAGSALWLHPFKDILSGMWVFKKSAWKQMRVYSDNWNFSQEIKLEALGRFGPKFQELPISYHPRVGEAKLSPFKVGAENLTYFLIHRLGLRKQFQK